MSRKTTPRTSGDGRVDGARGLWTRLIGSSTRHGIETACAKQGPELGDGWGWKGERYCTLPTTATGQDEGHLA